MEPGDLVVVEADPRRAEDLSRRYNVLASTLEIGCEGADVIVVAVKPGDVPAVVSRIGDVISESVHESVVVSLAAGVPVEVLEAKLSAGSPVVRVMPNTPMLVGQGTAAVARGRFAKDEHVDLVLEMMRSVGTAVVVTEQQMDAVTAISGSGPAYFFLLAEAMVEAAVERGLPRDVAVSLVTGTARGAGAMLAAGHDTPTELRAAVSSPGGTTAAAVRVLEAAGMRGAVYDAVQSAADKSKAMAEAAVRADGDDDVATVSVDRDGA